MTRKGVRRYSDIPRCIHNSCFLGCVPQFYDVLKGDIFKPDRRLRSHGLTTDSDAIIIASKACAILEHKSWRKVPENIWLSIRVYRKHDKKFGLIASRKYCLLSHPRHETFTSDSTFKAIPKRRLITWDCRCKSDCRYRG